MWELVSGRSFGRLVTASTNASTNVGVGHKDFPDDTCKNYIQYNYTGNKRFNIGDFMKKCFTPEWKNRPTATP
eukprot:UN02625